MTGPTCDGLGWCVKRDYAPPGGPWCNGAGRCVKGYATPVTGPAVPSAHDLVVEIREGDHIGMRCIPCRSVIAVRPIRAAAGLDKLNRLGREHCGHPAVPSDEELRGLLADVLRALHRDHSGHPNSTSEADALLPVVRRYADQRAAEEIERLADDRAWTTEHDNEVVSTRELYEQVARLRGELDPVTYDFPPDALTREATT